MDSLAEQHLETMDDLDYNVFSNKLWSELRRSHAQDVVVHWPDGHTTTGLNQHVADLEAMVVFAPDFRVTQHPVKIADGEWTAVIGIMEGTFTEPMPVGDGQTIAPTGRAFKLPMVTVSRWNAEGVMIEEYLLWDNQAFRAQLGIT